MKTEKSKERRDRYADVTIRLEVVEVFEDIIPMTPQGEISIGNQVDIMIDHHAMQGSRLGKITIDLSDYSDAFIPQEVKRL